MRNSECGMRKEKKITENKNGECGKKKITEDRKQRLLIWDCMRIAHRAECKALKDELFVRSSHHAPCAFPYAYRPAPFLIFRIPHSEFPIPILCLLLSGK